MARYSSYNILLRLWTNMMHMCLYLHSQLMHSVGDSQFHNTRYSCMQVFIDINVPTRAHPGVKSEDTRSGFRLGEKCGESSEIVRVFPREKSGVAIFREYLRGGKSQKSEFKTCFWGIFRHTSRAPQIGRFPVANAESLI